MHLHAIIHWNFVCAKWCTLIDCTVINGKRNDFYFLLLLCLQRLLKYTKSVCTVRVFLSFAEVKKKKFLFQLQLHLKKKLPNAHLCGTLNRAYLSIYFLHSNIQTFRNRNLLRWNRSIELLFIGHLSLIPKSKHKQQQKKLQNLSILFQCDLFEKQNEEKKNNKPESRVHYHSILKCDKISVVSGWICQISLSNQINGHQYYVTKWLIKIIMRVQQNLFG